MNAFWAAWVLRSPLRTEVEVERAADLPLPEGVVDTYARRFPTSGNIQPKPSSGCSIEARLARRTLRPARAVDT